MFKSWELAAGSWKPDIQFFLYVIFVVTMAPPP